MKHGDRIGTQIMDAMWERPSFRKYILNRVICTAKRMMEMGDESYEDFHDKMLSMISITVLIDHLSENVIEYMTKAIIEYMAEPGEPGDKKAAADILISLNDVKRAM